MTNWLTAWKHIDIENIHITYTNTQHTRFLLNKKTRHVDFKHKDKRH
jgi:hypothetical protein